MSALPAVTPPPWYARAVSWVLRAVGATTVERPTDFIAGADFARDYGVREDYSVAQSMSAFAAFGWVRAAVMAKAEDLSGLPIRVHRGRGKAAERIDDHPVLRLLGAPTTRGGALWLRMQLVVDLELVGDAYVLWTSASRSGPPSALFRLHPRRVDIVPGPNGLVDQYVYDAAGRRTAYPWDRVLHTRLPSWQDGPESLFGTGAIETMHNLLSAELALQKRTADAARRGRPDAIVRPADATTPIWTPDQIKAFKRDLQQAMNDSHGGVMVLGARAALDVLAWSPRDLETEPQRRMNREEILAVLGVPPTRLQLPTANYAQSQDAMTQYWEGLRARAKLYDEQLTRLAQAIDRRDDVYVEHDFARVSYLQGERTARQNRALAWYYAGLPLAAAASYEGFDDLPVPEEAEEDAAPLVGDPALGPGAGSVQDTALNGAQIASLLEVLRFYSEGLIDIEGAVAMLQVAFPSIDEAEARRILSGVQVRPPSAEAPEAPPAPDAPLPPDAAKAYAELRRIAGRSPPASAWLSRALPSERRAMPVPRTEDERAACWRGFVDQLQRPVEAQLKRAAGRYLTGARLRIAARAERVLAGKAPAKAVGAEGVVVREISVDELEQIVGSREEAEELRKALGPRLIEALRRAFATTAQQMGVDLTFAGGAAVDAFIGDMIVNVNATTRDRVRVVVSRGLDDGATIAEITNALRADPAFSAERAQRIGRTESTRALNAGGQLAMQDAREAGVRVRKQWLSARDGAVRPAHQALDGQTVPVDRAFIVPAGVEAAGQSAQYPGDFASAALVCNCRCTTIPIVED